MSELDTLKSIIKALESDLDVAKVNAAEAEIVHQKERVELAKAYSDQEVDYEDRLSRVLDQVDTLTADNRKLRLEREDKELIIERMDKAHKRLQSESRTLKQARPANFSHLVQAWHGLLKANETTALDLCMERFLDE